MGWSGRAPGPTASDACAGHQRQGARPIAVSRRKDCMSARRCWSRPTCVAASAESRARSTACVPLWRGRNDRDFTGAAYSPHFEGSGAHVPEPFLMSSGGGSENRSPGPGGNFLEKYLQKSVQSSEMLSNVVTTKICFSRCGCPIS